jgi:hypothetical protein
MNEMSRKLVRNSLMLLVWLVPLVCAAEICAATGNFSIQPALYFDYPLLDHRFYDFLDRIEVSGEVPLQSRIRPFLQFHFDSLSTESDIAESGTAESDIARGLTRGLSPLLGIGSREGRRFRSEGFTRHFIAEGRIEPPCESEWNRFIERTRIRNLKALNWLYATNHYFAALRLEDKFALTYQPVYGLEGIWTDPEAHGIRRSTAGFRLEGGFNRAVHFMVDFRDHGESGRSPYYSRTQLYEDRWAFIDIEPGARSVSYDISESFVQWYGRNLSATLGRGRHQWGPARFGQLFLSAEGPPFDYARFDAVFRGSRGVALHYTFLHGFLKPVGAPGDSLYVLINGRERIIDSRKFLAAQRYELRARSNLLLGFSQGVIYGDRGAELAYFAPLSFLYSVQHAHGDKDNLLISLDATWRPLRGLVTYGELLIDDMALSELFSATERSKSAFTLGLQAIPLRVCSFLDAQAEYTHIRPFVYSHVFFVNRYMHWESPLGYTLEPNSEFITTQLRATFYPLQFACRWQRQNHGANTPERNVGGDILMPLVEDQTGSYPFLAGRLEQTDRYSILATFEPLENLLLEGRITRVDEPIGDTHIESALSFSWNF